MIYRKIKNAVFLNFPNMENFGNGTGEKILKKHLTNRAKYDIIIMFQENKKKKKR